MSKKITLNHLNVSKPIGEEHGVNNNISTYTHKTGDDITASVDIYFDTDPHTIRYPELYVKIFEIMAGNNKQDITKDALATDKKIIEYKNYLFDSLNLHIPRSIDEKYINLIYYHYARGFNSQRKTTRYLTDDLSKLLGFDRSPSHSSLSRQLNKLIDNNSNTHCQIKYAAKHCVYAVYRQGFADQLLIDCHNLPNSDQIDLTNIDYSIKKAALYKTIFDYFDDVVKESLTFHRGNNLSYPIKNIVGCLAYCALTDSSPDNAANKMQHRFERSKIPTGGQIIKLIKSLNLGSATIDDQQETITDIPIKELYPAEIIRQGNDAYRQSFNFAAKHGALGSSGVYDFACDGTIIPSSGDYFPGDPDDPRVDYGGWQNANYDANSGWEYNIMSIINHESNLISSVRPILYHSGFRESITIDQLAHLMSIPECDVHRFYADRGYFLNRLIKKLRYYKRSDNDSVGDWDWIVAAKSSDSLSDSVKEAPKTKPICVPHNFGDLSEPTYVVLYPLVNDEPSESDSKEKSEQLDVRDFLTDSDAKQKPDQQQSRSPVISDPSPHQSHIKLMVDNKLTEEEMHELYIKYRNRGQIETIINQVKHDFAPKTESSYAEVRYYMMMISGLFYNLHQIINNGITPVGIDLNVDADELLEAIITTIFHDPVTEWLRAA